MQPYAQCDMASLIFLEKIRGQNYKQKMEGGDDSLLSKQNEMYGGPEEIFLIWI